MHPAKELEPQVKSPQTLQSPPYPKAAHPLKVGSDLAFPQHQPKPRLLHPFPSGRPADAASSRLQARFLAAFCISEDLCATLSLLFARLNKHSPPNLSFGLCFPCLSGHFSAEDPGAAEIPAYFHPISTGERTRQDLSDCETAKPSSNRARIQLACTEKLKQEREG